ncbi:hypothetical protein BGZ58_002779 [Dissophora ornata]|nr:hypothetical protein BGZ58_002779 [Dissophora ornata]
MARQQTAQMQQQQQFKPVDLTKEMAETYYWGRQDKAVETGNSDVNAFWMDFVEWDESKGGLFLSQNFVVNTSSFTSAMATIALLDVTFKPKEALIRRSIDRGLVVSSVSPAIVFHSSTKEVKETLITGSVLATQQYFVGLDDTEYDPKLMTDIRKYIPPGAEFRPLVSYGVHVVLMNATPNPMKLHVEVQLPQGAISIHGSLESAQDVQLSAHGTFQYGYHFYFPEEGDFPHYPAHVSDYEDVIAFAKPAVLKVRTPEPGEIQNSVDTSSWNYTLGRGSDEDVLSKLITDPLDGMRVELVWSVSLVLGGEEDQQLERKEKEEQLKLVGEYVENQAIAQKVGYWFTSPLLKRRPRSRHEATSKAFCHLEYFPLINARVHKATKNATILNDRFKAQYERFLTLLTQKPSHDVDDLFVLIVYLIAQDRILEAKEHFAKLSALVVNGHLQNQDGRERGACNFQQIQYDYLRAYLSLCVEIQVNDESSDLSLDLESVQEIVNKYQDYPVQRWSRLFQDMKTYVDEILGANSTPSSTTVETIESSLKTEEDVVIVTTIQESADDESTASDTNMPIKKKTRSKNIPVAVDFKIGSDSQITIHHRGIDEITVEYYAIDAETMFSASPLTFSDQGESEINVVANKANTGASSSMASSRKETSVFAQTSTFASPPSSTSGDSTSYRLVKPNGVDKHTVICADSETGVLRVPILDRYMNTNVMISVSTVPPAATRTWKAYYSQTISVQCQEHSGTIKVITKPVSGDSNDVDIDTNTTNQQPIRGGYVKVYAEMKNGSGDSKNTVFWKDGYTDLVGRFNYATVSTSASGSFSTPFSFGGSHRSGANRGGLADVKRFVVFVDGGKEGCVVKTVPVPPV